MTYPIKGHYLFITSDKEREATQLFINSKFKIAEQPDK